MTYDEQYIKALEEQYKKSVELGKKLLKENEKLKKQLKRGTKK